MVFTSAVCLEKYSWQSSKHFQTLGGISNNYFLYREVTNSYRHTQRDMYTHTYTEIISSSKFSRIKVTELKECWNKQSHSKWLLQCKIQSHKTCTVTWNISFFLNPNAIFQFSGPQAFQQTGSIWSYSFKRVS